MVPKFKTHKITVIELKVEIDSVNESKAKVHMSI